MRLVKKLGIYLDSKVVSFTYQPGPLNLNLTLLKNFFPRVSLKVRTYTRLRTMISYVAPRRQYNESITYRPTDEQSDARSTFIKNLIFLPRNKLEPSGQWCVLMHWRAWIKCGLCSSYIFLYMKFSISCIFHESITYIPTDGPTDGRTDRRTDRPSYRDARTHLKSKRSGSNSLFPLSLGKK